MSRFQPVDRTRPNSYCRSCLYASFPALIDLVDKNGDPLRLTEQEWLDRVKNKEWKQETKSDPYFANRRKIFALSAKLREIAGIWRHFAAQKDGAQEFP